MRPFPCAPSTGASGACSAWCSAAWPLLAALAALAAGGAAVVLDQTQRDADGYLMTGSTTYSTGTYALVSDSYRAGTAGDWFVARDLLGTVRVRVDSRLPVFVGIGSAAVVDDYLAGVGHEVATRFDSKASDFRLHTGGAPSAPPTAEPFWAAAGHRRRQARGHVGARERRLAGRADERGRLAWRGGRRRRRRPRPGSALDRSRAARRRRAAAPDRRRRDLRSLGPEGVSRRPPTRGYSGARHCRAAAKATAAVATRKRRPAVYVPVAATERASGSGPTAAATMVAAEASPWSLPMAARP